MPRGEPRDLSRSSTTRATMKGRSVRIDGHARLVLSIQSAKRLVMAIDGVSARASERGETIRHGTPADARWGIVEMAFLRGLLILVAESKLSDARRK